MIVDAHAHLIPPDFLDRLRRPDHGIPEACLISEGGQERLTIYGRSFPVRLEWFDQQAILSDMDRRQIDLAVLSPSPFLFAYGADPQMGLSLCQSVNDAVTAFCGARPDRFVGLGQVPLQDIPAAIEEMERAVSRLGLKGIEIAANVGGRDLDSPEFFPFLERAAQLGVPLFVHPYNTQESDRLRDYYLVNLIGNPLDTAIAISRLAFSGTLARLPGLKLLFAHGGGYAPFGRGRWDHGYRVRAECRVNLEEPPGHYLAQCRVDTIAHSPAALDYVIRTMGLEQVLLGSDYPFDMADPDPVATVRELRLTEAERRAILGGNAVRFFGL